MSCYNNGPWECNNYEEVDNCCEPSIKPSYLITQIVPISIDLDSGGGTPSNGCLNITVLPSNITILYVGAGDIIARKNLPGVTGNFITLDPLSYSSYECNTLSSISLAFDLSSITAPGTSTDPYFKNTSTFTIDLPVDRTETINRFTLQVPQPLSGCGTVTEAELLISYYYTGYCSNITVTVSKIRVRYIDPNYPLYVNPVEDVYT